MKYNITVLISVVVLMCLLSSCQKVIDLQLNTSPTQIVIQGNVYDQAGPYLVKISNSVKFSDPNVYPAVTGAKVTISDNTGNTEVLTEQTAGNYVTSSLQGIPGRTYTLTVISASQTYTAVSTMPLPVKIDSLYFKLSPFGNEKLLTARFLDPANTVNYYRMIEFINNEQQQRFNVANDELNNGNVIDYSFRPQGGNDTIMVKGANVTVWLESIDKGVYEYFRTAGRDGSQSASPANPTSNFNNGALGYFSACAMTQKGIKVP